MQQLQPILEIPRKLVILAILLASILIASFIALEVSSVSREPIKRYNNSLVQLYFITDDWDIIRYIEVAADPTEMDPQLLELYRVQFWKNYTSTPERYWSILGDDPKDQPVLYLFQDRDEEYLSFIINKQDYKLKEERLFVLNISEMLLVPIEEIIEEINIQTDVLNKALADGDRELVHRSLLRIETASTSYGSRSRIESTNELFLFSPQYELVVYDSFRRAPYSLLQEQAKAIIYDKREDPVLRLMAAQYLAYDRDKDSVNPESTEVLLQLIETLIASKTFVEDQMYNAAIEAAFQQGLLDIVGSSVLEYVENAPPSTPTPRR